MTNEDKQLMARYGITWETRTIFRFQGHQYDRLLDALRYAKKQRTLDIPPTPDAA